MARRKFTVDRYKEIERRLKEGRGVREIARHCGCPRATMRDVRDGMRRSTAPPKPGADPLWSSQLDWPYNVHELVLGRPLPFTWEEPAQTLTSNANFWKQFHR